MIVIIERIRSIRENVELPQFRVLFLVHLIDIFLKFIYVKHLLRVLINLLPFLIKFILDDIPILHSLFRRQSIVNRIHVVPTLKSVRMDQAELFIEYHPSTSFFAYVLVSILSLHVFSWKYALLELEVYTVLTQSFSIKLTLNLLNKLVNSVSKNKVTFISRMSMQI